MDEDPVMNRVRELLAESGMTQHDLGVKMGYSEEVARKAVWQFLKSKDPRIGMLRKFAAAVGIPIEELVAVKRATARRRKK